MSKPEVSDTKLKLQRIINHISYLERNVNNGDLTNVPLIQQQLEADFNQLEHLPLHKINTEIKRRQLKRKAAKARSKLHKTIVNKSNQTNTKSITTSTATNELSSTNIPPPSVPPPQKTHRQLLNYHTAQRMLRTFELLKKLHYARCQDLEATRKLSANLQQLEARWSETLHQNQLQHTQQSKLEDQWDVAFFGPKQYNLHNTGVLAKNSSDLLEIRHTWDSYLTNSKMHGSSIPTGWVLPHAQADERWLAYRKIP